MDSVPPYPIGPGKRVLAAIVFTDVVSFSRRMHREEVPTLELVEHDFGIMRNLAEKHGGAVLKTTGDGLLLYFTSAVQAVGFALIVQRQFARRARAHPDESHLSHRVGIHLGDVFMKDDDVMGDGVNTAARLQAEADPGGICISQTVYDVVNNKIELQVARMAPRGPKSIAEPVTIYRVAIEAGTLQPVAAPAPVPYHPLPEKPRAAGAGGQKFLGAILLLLLLAGAAGLVWQWQQKHGEELESSQAAKVELGALLAAKERKSPGSTTAAPSADAPDGKGIRPLRSWLDETLTHYTRDRPLRLRELSGAFTRDAKLFVDSDRRLYFAEGGAVRSRAIAELKPDALGAVIVSCLLDSPQPPPREILEGALEFARMNGLTEMQATLSARGK